MNALVQTTRRIPSSSLLRKLCYGLCLPLLLAGCVLEPFSLLGAPCAGEKQECPAGEVCLAGICRAEGSSQCDSNESCGCGRECDNSAKACVPIRCTKDAQCARDTCEYYCDLPNFTCVKGKPPGKLCEASTDCGGKVCVDRRCTDCTKNEDCPDTGRCDTSKGTCEPCTKNADCPTGICKKGKCVNCGSNTDCAPLLCKDRVCSKCTDNSECTTGRCDTSSGECLPCKENKDCSTQLCLNGKCEQCRQSSECANNGVCKEGNCISDCTQNSECASNLCKDKKCLPCSSADDCSSKRCVEGKCLGPCSNSSECFSGRECVSGVCEKPGEGATCAPPLNCRDPFLCIDEPKGKVCRKACDPLNPQCPSGQACRYLPDSPSNPGICEPTDNGSKNEGELCDPKQKGECKAPFICAEDKGEARCKKLCDTSNSNCKQGETCVKITENQPKVGVCLGETCANTPSLCKTGEKCINNQCRKVCTSNSNCDTKTEICTSEGAEKVCKEKQCNAPGKFCATDHYCSNFLCSKLSPEPKACTSAGQCASGEICAGIPGIPNDALRCWKTCTSSLNCKTGTQCVLLPTALNANHIRACLPKIGAGLTGAECNGVTSQCESSHLCVTARSSPTDSRCLLTCDTRQRVALCPSNYDCLGPLRQGTNFGACVRTSPKISVNKECGLHKGDCGTSALCYSNTTHKDKTPYCRKICNFSSCSGGYRCVTTTSQFQSGTFVKVCIPPNP